MVSSPIDLRIHSADSQTENISKYYTGKKQNQKQQKPWKTRKQIQLFDWYELVSDCVISWKTENIIRSITGKRHVKSKNESQHAPELVQQHGEKGSSIQTWKQHKNLSGHLSLSLRIKSCNNEIFLPALFKRRIGQVHREPTRMNLHLLGFLRFYYPFQHVCHFFHRWTELRFITKTKNSN